MYSIDETTKSSGTKQFAPGITENVKITGIVRENSKDDGSGTEVLRFYFEGPEGELFTHTEFPIDADRLRELAKGWNNADPDKVVENAFKDLGARIKHILASFLPEEEIIVKDAKGWEDYCDKIVALAGKKYEGVLLRIKVVLNTKDYNSFPKKALSRSYQNMEEKNLLRITRYDRIVPLQPNDEYTDPDTVDDDEDDFEDEF